MQRDSGRSVPFADPTADPNTAPIFWSTDCLRSSLPVLARRALADPAQHADLDLSQLSNVRRILIDGSGAEHIVLQSGYQAITLVSQGASVIEAPVNLTFLIHGLAGVATASRLLRLARSLLENAEPAKSDPAPWYRKLREVLVALDGYQASAPQREIAAILYGRDIAEAAWRGGNFSLKQRVHRAIAKGKALSAGGYVSLLP
jgi:hypothetical protein